MIAVQKPPLPLFSAPTFRQSHSRHPSAPVVVRPTHTPGVLSLSKPLPQRLQQPPQPQRPPRVPRSKPQQRSPRPVPAQAASVEKPAPVNTQKAVGASPEEAKLQPALVIPNPDRSTRGRQQSKLAKDKADRRSISVSSSRISARRLAHQPSPPPTRIPSQAEASTKLAVTPVLAHARVNHASNVNSFDPFIDTSDKPSSPEPLSFGKVEAKAMPSFTLPPRLASPSGKLARRRQLSAQILGSPTPKSTSASRRKDKTAAQNGRDASFPILGVPVSKLAFATPSRRIPTRRASTGLPVSDWDSFPICDDSADLAQDSDVTPPSTPIRESASVPFKKGARLAAVDFNNGPRTAPISSAFRFPFVSSSPCPSPTPSHRRRYHQRVPSDGVFNLSMDEDSSSSTSDLLELIKRAPVSIPKHRSQSEPASSPTQSRALAAEHPISSSAPEAGYYAGSVFQNSPSPDDLPAPSFTL